MTKHKNTPPGIGKNAAPGVMHNPDASRAHTRTRVVDRRDIKDIPCSQTARACAHTRTRVENPAAYFKAWRMAKWGGDFDPVLAAVEEVVSSFSNRVVGFLPPSHTTERAFYGTPRFQLFGNANGINPIFLNHSFPMALLACANCDFRHHPLRHIAVSHA